MFVSILFVYTVVDTCAEMLDEEKFIGEVGERLTLYDITLNDYSSPELKVKCWMEICF
jgi:uncharacterized protein YutD